MFLAFRAPRGIRVDAPKASTHPNPLPAGEGVRNGNDHCAGLGCDSLARWQRVSEAASLNQPRNPAAAAGSNRWMREMVSAITSRAHSVS